MLYVHNITKLEAGLIGPKRIAALETWRRNDEKAMHYLRSLGFRVREAGEDAPSRRPRPRI